MSKLTYRKSLNGTYDFKLDDGWCVANCGLSADACIIYLIMTEPSHQGKGEAQRLLMALKDRCIVTHRDLIVRSPNEPMKHICDKLDILIFESLENSPYRSATGFANKIHEILKATKNKEVENAKKE